MLSSNIKNFIAARIRETPQCGQWLSDWSIEHETQINIDPTGLEPCQWQGTKPTRWEMPDGNSVGPIRIPYGAYTDSPTHRDYMPRGPIHHYWSAIGTTGWNWSEKKSMWVGFDFDAIEGHAAGVGIAPDRLNEIKNRATSLPYVIARTSKGGKGLHLIVPLNPWIAAETHTEHSALAKHVLNRMSRDCDYPLYEGVDCSGLVLWHWAKEIAPNGFQRIE